MGGIRPFSHEKEHEEIKEDIWISTVIRSSWNDSSDYRHFDIISYSLWHLFEMEKKKFCIISLMVFF